MALQRIPVSCPNIMKFYNDGMNGVDIMDEKTAVCRFDGKIKHCLYLSMLISCMWHSDIGYMKLWDGILLLNFKIVVSKEFNWLDTVIVIDPSPLLGQAKESLTSHPWTEKSQPSCPSSSRIKWDVVIARM